MGISTTHGGSRYDTLLVEQSVETHLLDDKDYAKTTADRREQYKHSMTHVGSDSRFYAFFLFCFC
ncbi:hypothetical protein ACVIHI_001903 [Bradyrhizobium sp. USDA 4524]|uniref:hypothetical protein n=1 Tax=unclassified Bradyrhizobium TaxID=2631580 RepID=UPI0020A1469D|nr:MULTISPECIES: hypothetical protein [unclassified Bradyrhizobium]MCP1845176.1 hypothetical protein [Bradyrhizobium sp. USDA 4538]MCP1905741.1 hypothetical protein [Bradyrhizobium sp. USDA 4537]MCP1988603.1 hypothetical protein [Bradyrhizobium sp. USDA 4539]